MERRNTPRNILVAVFQQDNALGPGRSTWECPRSLLQAGQTAARGGAIKGVDEHPDSGVGSLLAQTTTVTGKVTLKQADGTEVPATSTMITSNQVVINGTNAISGATVF